MAQQPQGSWVLKIIATAEFRPAGSGAFSIVSSVQSSEVSVGPSTPVGTGYSAIISGITLEPRGNGDYRITVSAAGTCNNVAYSLTPNNPAPSPNLTVTRPVITGPGATLGPYGIWWLGGASDDANGYYNRVTLSVNTNGNPGSFSWSAGGSDKVTLSCTTCTFPLVTSAKPSTNCTYDVGIYVSFSGFTSNMYLLNINAPFYVESGGLSSTSDFLDGWLTVVPYVNRDRCNYPMPSIALNETFGSFTNLTTNNWAKPSAGGVSSYGGYTWYDQMFIYSCPSCSPPAQQGNPPGQTAVDQAQQFWNLGSATPGLGIYVQQDTFRRYTGHGEHLNVLRILY